MTLWHFTCDHGYNGIGRRGVLRPNRHPLMPVLGPVVWLTDDPAPSRDAVGLTSTYIRCDRMAYRYRVDAVDAYRWDTISHSVDPELVDVLESLAQPSTWWLSSVEIPAVLA